MDGVTTIATIMPNVCNVFFSKYYLAPRESRADGTYGHMLITSHGE